MNKPFLSFVLINYNYEEYISDAISSIAAQSFSDFECHIIDNNSSDRSIERIRPEIYRDNRFTVVRNVENLNQMGAFLSLLDKLKGDYISIVDADDFLFEDYAAYHLQAHLSSEQPIAMSSNAVLEVDGSGHPLSAGYAPFLRHTIGKPFRINASKASDWLSGFDRGRLVAHTVFIPSSEGGWHWSPGTANVYSKRFLLLARPAYSGGVYVAATDNYFAPFVHALGNSACIDLPLSAYRIHGKNRHGAMSTFPTLRTATPSGFERSRVRRRDITDTLASRAVEFMQLYPDTFWSLMDSPAAADGIARSTYFTSGDVKRILARHYQVLCLACGKAKTDQELSSRMTAPHFKSFKLQLGQA